MTRKRWIVIGLVSALLIMIAGLVIAFAPQTTGLQSAADTNAATCLQAADGACLVLPQISGVDVDNQAVSFPDAFNADYTLIVMPFDREQQVAAAEWLPLFQSLATDDAAVDYVSIAALPDLNAAIRLLVIGGMSAGVDDPDVRSRLTLFFLDEQAALLDALAIPDTDSIMVWIADGDGVLLYRDSGTFNDERGAALSAALAALRAPS